jgi:hypothetical protein
MSKEIIITLGITILLSLTIPSAAADLVISRDGRGSYQIIVPNDRRPAIEYAAEELQHFLEEIAGAKLPIVTAQEAGPTPAFLLGPSARVEKAGLGEKTKGLSDDGVFVKTVGKDIVLLGMGDRGQLYSVYVLLERFLGVRFLAQDCTYIPHKKRLVLPAIDYSYSPQFLYREAIYYEASKWDFALRQRLNGGNSYLYMGRSVPDKTKPINGFVIYPFVHSFAYLLPSDRYFADHPEYFGLVNGKRVGKSIDGQLCLSNPDVLKIAKDQVLRWFDQYPQLASVNISQNDSATPRGGACECDKCAAIVKEEGSLHGPILRFVNAIADAVAERYPNKYVDTLSYAFSTVPPKVTKPRDNVIIRLCHTGCYFHGIEHEEMSGQFRASIEGWRKIAKHLFIWHYGTNFAHFLAPNPNLESLAKDIKYYAAHDINGLMVEGSYETPSAELSELRQYLIAQLMWDPAQDPMAIRRDFCQGYYGPAAGEALEFLALMDRLGETTDKHVAVSWNPSEVATPEFVPSALAILNRGLAKAGDQTHRNRIEKLMLPIWYVQLMWPERYGLSKEEGHVTWRRLRNTIKANGILTTGEGYDTAPNGAITLVYNLKDFIARMDARYGE